MSHQPTTVRRLTVVCPNATVELGPLKVRDSRQGMDIYDFFLGQIGLSDRIPMMFDWLPLPILGLVTAVSFGMGNGLSSVTIHSDQCWPTKKAGRADGFKYYCESIGPDPMRSC